MGVRFEPVSFLGPNGLEYAAILDLAALSAFEARQGEGIGTTLERCQTGQLGAIIPLVEAFIRRKAEVGLVVIEPQEVGALLRHNVDGANLAFGAVSQALAAVGNAYGLAVTMPSPAPSNGQLSVGRKPVSRRKTG